MANSFGTVQVATLVSQEILAKLRFKLPMIFNFAHRFEPLLKWGQAITIHDVGEGTVADVTAANGYGSGETSRTDTAHTVTVNKWKEYRQTWESDTMHSSERDLVEEEGNRGAYKLAKTFVDDVLDTLLPTYTNVTTTSAAAEDFDVTDVRGVRRKIVERGLQGPFFGVVNSDGWYGLTGDSVVIAAEPNDANNNVVQGAELKRVSNIQFSEYAGMNTIAGNTFGFVAEKPGMLITAGAPQDIAEMVGERSTDHGYRTGVETDPETGLSIRWLFFLDGRAQTAEIVYSIMYGYAKGREASMEVLKSTT